MLNIRSMGVKLSQKDKKLPDASYKIDKVMDSTGAGDAFWSGFYLRTSKIKPSRNV
jgi:fructokinase